MTVESKATPRPWTVGKTRFGSWGIAGGAFTHESPLAQIQDWDEAAEGDARLIVRAVNSHDALVEALQGALLQIEYLHAKFTPTGTGEAVLAKLRALLSEIED